MEPLSALPPPFVRCLRILRCYPAIPHAARRLHCSQKALLQEIAAVRQQLGGDAIQVTMGRATLHPELDRLLGG